MNKHHFILLYYFLGNYLDITSISTFSVTLRTGSGNTRMSSESCVFDVTRVAAAAAAAAAVFVLLLYLLYNCAHECAAFADFNVWLCAVLVAVKYCSHTFYLYVKKVLFQPCTHGLNLQLNNTLIYYCP